MNPEIFPQMPEDITALTRDEVNELITQFNAAFASVATGEAFADMENPPDRNERRDMLAAAKDHLVALKAHLSTFEEEDSEFAAEVAELAEAAGVELPSAAAETETETAETEQLAAEGEPAPEGDEPAEPAPGDEPESEAVVEGAEPVVAAGARKREYRTKPAPTPKQHQTLTLAEGPVSLRAAAGVPDFQPGVELDRAALAQITAEAIRQGVSSPPGMPFKMRLATANWSDMYPEERKVDGDDPYADMRRLDAARGRSAQQALAAAGGWCAPSVIRYDIGTLGVTERPVRDNLTAFNSTRGGLRYFVDLSIAETDTTDGITRLTEEQDEGGTTTKDCVVVECPTDTDVRADIIASCLQAGNLASIAFPELIAAWQDLLAIATARNADSGLLDMIADDPQTEAVTSDAVYGSFHSVARAFLKVAMGYRSRHRLGAGDPLMALAPAWLADNIVLDLVGRQFPWPQEVSRAGVASLLERLTGVRVEWYLDSESGAGQIIGAQGAGPLVDFPLEAVTYIYPPGGILFIDQGQLNIGLVRDSALNETNDVRFFSEVFEAAAVVATEVFRLTISLNPNGTAAAATAAAAAAAAS